MKGSRVESREASKMVELATLALPLMDEAARAEAEQLIYELARTTNAETLQEFTRRAAAAFEADMKPIVDAVVSALRAGDAVALQGLREMLPRLLVEVNEAPALADLLAHQLGTAVLAGMKEGNPRK